MKRLIAVTLSLTLLATAISPALAAPYGAGGRDEGRQHASDHDRNHGKHTSSGKGHAKHEAPRRGGHLQRDHRGTYVRDYHRHGLRDPGRGHEWRQVDNRYVLIAVATGLIADVVLGAR